MRNMGLHIRLIDPKIRRNFGAYVFQCSLAAAAVFLVLVLEGAHLSRVVIIAAIGSTAFVLFVTPHSVAASPRHVVGGHLICLTIGSAFAAFDGTGFGIRLLEATPLVFDIEAAVAVGLGIFLMAATDTEHAPAAGTALGMVAHDFSWSLVIFVVGSVVGLSMLHMLLRPRLRNLL